MSIHPNVLAVCPSAQKKLFTSFEDFARSIATVGEAWLNDDKWMPEFLYISEGPGTPIRGNFLPSFTNSGDLARTLQSLKNRYNFTVIGLLVGARTREPGQPPPSLPNTFLAISLSQDGKESAKAWHINLNGDGSVSSYTPAAADPKALALNWTSLVCPLAN